ncbi:MAG: 50S ribosomal protein L10 [Clostridia bacterium]|nr:50S ribosomal protein L10 [Clostridia bacterium]
MPSQKVLEEKKQIVSAMTEQFKTAVSGVFVDYCGLTVEEDTQLRNKLREAGVEYKVIKNTLTRFAAKEVGFDELDPILNGPTSLAISMTDEVAPAKVIADFAKSHEQLEIKAGFLDGKVLALDEVKKLAATPNRETLLAKLLGSLNAPISNLARTLQALVDNGVEPADIKVEKEEAPAEEAAPEVVEAPAEEAPVAEEAPAPEAEAPTEE